MFYTKTQEKNELGFHCNAMEIILGLVLVLDIESYLI